ncbi:hypothetical protein LB456_10225 [Psychroflexus sp. CAK57W]|uniref:hypothetical protein n=1 Tax=Psychroflexus curvus TaxID=2873595 RepID=UPI001CCE382C|nr:hypothetical protein [Psychroflexus curvus]MBZ9787830.1 hypothetical protein [Psychroflexus curvus]
MKISFLTPEYPHPNCTHSAGIGTSIYNLSKALLQQGQKVRILVYGQNQDEIFEDNAVIVQKIKNTKLKGFSPWLNSKDKMKEKIIEGFTNQRLTWRGSEMV